MTPKETPPEVLAIAREIGAKHDANKAYQYLDGSRDDYPDMRMIIAAIMEVTERAAKMAEGFVEKNETWAGKAAANEISAALRAMDHLK